MQEVFNDQYGKATGMLQSLVPVLGWSGKRTKSWGGEDYFFCAAFQSAWARFAASRTSVLLPTIVLARSYASRPRSEVNLPLDPVTSPLHSPQPNCMSARAPRLSKRRCAP